MADKAKAVAAENIDVLRGFSEPKGTALDAKSLLDKLMKSPAKTKRDEMFKEIEKATMLDMTPPVLDKWAKFTQDPDPFNKTFNAARLLNTTDPQWTVPYERANKDAKRQSSAIEKTAARILQMNNKVRGKRLAYDNSLSGLIYSEIVNVIYPVEQLMKNATENDKAMLEQVAKQTPLLFKERNPRMGFPVNTLFGTKAYCFQFDIITSEAINQYGENARIALGGAATGSGGADTPVTVKEYWDFFDVHIWINDILIESHVHNVGRLPIVTRICEGSDLFQVDTTYQTRIPFLYAMWKSGLWERENLAFTVLSSLALAIGANPLLTLHQSNEDDHVTVNNTGPLSVTEVPMGARLEVLSKQVIDPSLIQLQSLLAKKVEESTMYAQAFGQPVGANATFSYFALLHQAGRLPLVNFQRGIGDCLADTLLSGFRILQNLNYTKKFKALDKDGEKYEVDFMKLPDELELNCQMEVSLPQDMRSNIQAAIQAIQAKLGSKRWARENLLQIGQSDEMEKEIYFELAAEPIYQQMAQEEILLLQQALQEKIAMNSGANGGGGETQQQPPAGEAPPTGVPPEAIPPDQAGGQEGLPGVGLSQPPAGLPGEPANPEQGAPQ